MPSHLIILAIVLVTWQRDETIRSYGAGDTLWQLQTINGTDTTAAATLQFTQRHKISGQGPCNGYHMAMNTPYPWFTAGPIAATKRACPDLPFEAAFFRNLSAATLADIENGQLILSDDDGVLMTFVPAD